MRKFAFALASVTARIALLLVVSALPAAAAFRLLSTHEPTIADIHAAMRAKELTCRQLVQMYLDRIEAYDRKGPALNAIVMVNPNALNAADALDARFAQSGLVGPLHCVPMIVKDNFDTADMPTAAGSLSLKSSAPPREAFQVRKLPEAGGLVLAKSNMAEFARSPFETVNSLIPGHPRNPHAPDRVPAGSGGGTAAAVAASFGAAGLGTDTGNSIRGPSSHTSLVGIRSTMGLTSRAGIVPLFLNRDIGGPMARTVADAVAIFDVVAGSDPADPATAPAQERRPASYLSSLDKDGLKGARIGVLRQMVAGPDPDAEVMQLFEQALADMKRQGAEIVDAVQVPEIDQIPASGFACDRFKHDLDAYLAELGPRVPMKSLEQIITLQKFHPLLLKLLLDSPAEPPLELNSRCQVFAENGRRLDQSLLKANADAQLDTLTYPS